MEKEARSPSHYEKDPSSSDGAAARKGVCVREREGAVRAHTAGERERRRRREVRHSKALLDASCMPYGEVATS